MRNPLKRMFEAGNPPLSTDVDTLIMTLEALRAAGVRFDCGDSVEVVAKQASNNLLKVYGPASSLSTAKKLQEKILEFLRESAV